MGHQGRNEYDAKNQHGAFGCYLTSAYLFGARTPLRSWKIPADRQPRSPNCIRYQDRSTVLGVAGSPSASWRFPALCGFSETLKLRPSTVEPEPQPCTRFWRIRVTPAFW